MTLSQQLEPGGASLAEHSGLANVFGALGATVQVVNRKHAGPPAPGVRRIYIGRPSVFGNPYILRGDASRGSTLERYEAHLLRECKQGGALKDAILNLARQVASGERVELECFCCPLPCHGHLLALAIVGYARRLLPGEGSQGAGTRSPGLKSEQSIDSESYGFR